MNRSFQDLHYRVTFIFIWPMQTALHFISASKGIQQCACICYFDRSYWRDYIAASKVWITKCLHVIFWLLIICQFVILHPFIHHPQKHSQCDVYQLAYLSVIPTIMAHMVDNKRTSPVPESLGTSLYPHRENN